MSKLKIYQVDAFSDKVFHGNPAAVIPLKKWLKDSTMQSIAAENNLAETAFFTKEISGYHIRWFTPTTEVELCGHATLATAFVIDKELKTKKSTLQFQSLSGTLLVYIHKSGYTLDFPADTIIACPIPNGVEKAIGCKIIECFKGKSDFILRIKDEESLLNINPNFELIKKIGGRGIIVTCEGKEVDFVSRCFYPQYGINEDPVTGSAHTSLTPYWSKILNKQKMKAMQLSERKGWIKVEDREDRIYISGKASLYLKGTITI